jgi:hypothetical protein
MAVKNIIAVGFGSFSEVKWVPTFGFTAGAVAVTQITDMADTYRVYTSVSDIRRVAMLTADSYRPRQEVADVRH